MMADIDVVPKRRTGMWVWLLVAIAIIVVLWLAFGRSAMPRQTGRVGVDSPQPVAAIDYLGEVVNGIA